MKDSFSAFITEWNNFDLNIWNSSSINVFKNRFKFIRLEASITYGIHDNEGLKLMQRGLHCTKNEVFH